MTGAFALVGATIGAAANSLFLGLIVGPLQAFIFLTLGAIYLTAATHVDDHGDEMGGVEGHHPHAQAH